jgi:hypothetical protein
MPLTKSFKSTIIEKAIHDSEFRHSMLAEALNELLSGDMNIGKAMLRDYIYNLITLSFTNDNY